MRSFAGALGKALDKAAADSDTETPTATLAAKQAEQHAAAAVNPAANEKLKRKVCFVTACFSHYPLWLTRTQKGRREHGFRGPCQESQDRIPSRRTAARVLHRCRGFAAGACVCWSGMPK